MGGRLATGLGQLFLALAGFALFVAWFVLTMKEGYDVAFHDAPAKSYKALGLAGLGLFFVAWIWSLVTSLSLLRQARAAEPPDGPPVPPPTRGAS